MTILSRMKEMPTCFRIYTATAAKTMGKMQYPSTQTHWKKEMCPPSSLVLIVTMKAPPHINRKTTPNSFPLELMPILRMLSDCRSTAIERGREWADPRDPLNHKWSTIPQHLHTFGIAFHVELGDDHISQLGEDILQIARLYEQLCTIVAQTYYSRVSEWALTSACILIQILYPVN